MTRAKSGAKGGFGTKLLRWGMRVLNIALGLFLVLQLAILVVLLRDGELPVPAFVIEKIEQKLEAQGIKARIDSVEVDLRGLLLLRGVKLGVNEYSDYLAEADLVLLHFPPWAIVSGFMPDEVWVSSSEFFCPAVLSPTGQREAVANDIFTEIKISRDEITLERLLLRVGTLDAVIRGTMVRPEGDITDLEDDESEAGKSLAETYTEICHGLLEAHAWLSRFTEPELWINLRIEQEESRAYMRLQTQDFNLGNGAEGKHLVLKALGAGQGPDTYQLRRVMFQVNDVAYGDQISAESLQAIAILPEDSKERWPDTLNIGGHELKGWGLALSAFSGTIDLGDLQRPEGKVYLQEGTNWMNVNGWVDAEKETADVAVEALWDPTYFFSSSLLGDDKAHFPDLACEERPRWGARVFLDEHYAFNHVDVTVNFGKTRLQKLELESVYARATGSKDSLEITEAILTTERYSINGSYRQDLKTNHYRFLVYGHLDPLDIGFIIDEDWWDPLWKRFEYHDQLPYANLDLSGYYGGGTRDKYFFGYNEFWDFSYNGIETEHMTAMLWRSPLQLTLYDMLSTGKHGIFDATLQFNYVEKRDDRESLAFAVAGMLPLDVVGELIGPEAKEITDEFDTKGQSDMQVTGIVYGEDSPRNGELYLNILGHMKSQVVYEGYVFDFVKFQALKTPDAIRLPHFDFGMAGGTGSGKATVHVLSEDRRKLDLSLNMTNAKYLLLKEAVPFFEDGSDTAQGGEAVTKSAKSLEEKKKAHPKAAARETEALVDLDLDVTGDLGELETFDGYGRFKIKDAFLGQLHLFGGLSRVVQSVGLNLGTVEFNQGHAPFLIGKGYLHFPNVVVAGDTAKIKANGNINLTDDGLDFYVSLYPLGGINIPVISQIFSIINPITNTIESHLTGTVDEPDWDVGISLGAVFTGQEKVDNPTGQKFPDGFLEK